MEEKKTTCSDIITQVTNASILKRKLHIFRVPVYISAK